MDPAASRIEPSDEVLTTAVRRGDEHAFAVLHRRYAPALLRFACRRLGSTQDAEDAVQETFARAHRALMDQGRRVDLRPWLFAVTRNTCTDILRRGRARETFQDFDALPTHAAWADPHQSFEQRERLRLIVADLRELPTRQRLALGAGVFAGHSHQDVATSLNTTTDHAKVLVFRARTSLRAADRRRAAFGLAA